MAQYTITLLSKTQVSHDAWNFAFSKPAIDFLPGQYLRMILPIEQPDDRGNARFFTIASSPTNPHLHIVTRIIQSSFKKTLLDLPIGTEIQIFAPLGSFTLSDNPKQLFLAGGIGITPFL